MTRQQDLDRLERMEKKLKWQPNVSCIPLVFPGDRYCDCGAELKPGENFCSQRCARIFFEINE